MYGRVGTVVWRLCVWVGMQIDGEHEDKSSKIVRCPSDSIVIESNADR
jgi:hypothetical protein